MDLPFNADGTFDSDADDDDRSYGRLTPASVKSDDIGVGLFSTSPTASAGDSGIDAASFESAFTEPDATVTNFVDGRDEELDVGTDADVNNFGALFNKLYESFIRLDLDEFDGFDSPKRLYNRSPSSEFSKTEEELTKELLVRTSKLSSNAAEFVPSQRSSSISSGSSIKEDLPTWPSLDGFFMALQKLIPAFINTSSFTTPVVQMSRQFGSATSTPIKTRHRPALSRAAMVCCFCQKSGFEPFVVASHSLRNPVTKEIICPNLKDNVCTICGPSQEDWLLHRTDQCAKINSNNSNNTSNNFLPNFNRRN